jgi:hypothetical protein
MFATNRAVLSLAVALPGLLLGQDATAQVRQPTDRTMDAAPRAEQSLAPQAPVGHRQPRAADLPAPAEPTAADRERERKDRELDKRLRICRNC